MPLQEKAIHPATAIPLRGPIACETRAAVPGAVAAGWVDLAEGGVGAACAVWGWADYELY
jgi:hypothetical protein